MRRYRHVLVVLLMLVAASVAGEQALRLAAAARHQAGKQLAAAPDNAASAAAFTALLPVLRHPRCMNCHSRGDFPRQGDDEHQHTMNVRRGLNGEGVAGLQCSTCHQDQNLVGEHMPPGAPGWHLPSPQTPMIWENLSDRQLCELLKDPARNGHRTVKEIVGHMSSPLVRWGWHPGEGRTPIPTPQGDFLAKVKEWAARGAACPGETGPTARTDASPVKE
ncbi:MAG TPA: hypothetical protein VFT65_02000 [Candidatus Angelobacter sp.]|nr:hypothetical protein [Candidatus Angelobacter sp.]